MKIVNGVLYLTQLEYDTLIKCNDYFNSADPELWALSSSLRKSLDFPRNTVYSYKGKITSITFWDMVEGDTISHIDCPFNTWKIYE